jgi:hypothetical protein
LRCVNLCFAQFIERKRLQREAFMIRELYRYSNKTKIDFVLDQSMKSREKLNLLLQMNRHYKKYTKLFGEDRTNHFFKSLDYTSLLNLMDVRNRFGEFLKPSQINTMVEDKKGQIIRLNKALDLIQKRIYLEMEERGSSSLSKEQYENIRAVHKYRDSIKWVKKDISLLEKAQLSTNHLVKFEPVEMIAHSLKFLKVGIKKNKSCAEIIYRNKLI